MLMTVAIPFLFALTSGKFLRFELFDGVAAVELCADAGVQRRLEAAQRQRLIQHIAQV